MLLLTLALAGLAHAQDANIELNSQVFHPTIDGTRTLWTDDATQADSGTPTGRVVLSYMNRPFIYVPGDGAAPVALVRDALQADLLGGYTLGPVRLGVDLPVYLFATGELGSGAGLGDIALDAKGTFLDNEDGPGLAASARLALNTATVNIPLGAPKVRGELAVIADYETHGLLAALNLGVRLDPTVALSNVTLGDQIFFRLGAGYQVVEDAGFSLDIVGHQNLSVSMKNRAAHPIEAMVGGWVSPMGGLTFRGGLGTGLTAGVGSPVFRAMLSAGYAPSGKPPKDTDGDGIVDRQDQCIEQPEDPDAFQDDDGCPDPDNDADGVLDADDACPNDPEDMDEWEDDDGCPEPAMLVAIRIEDPNGAVIPTATTSIVGTGVDHHDDGDFSTGLAPGLYSIDVDADGFVGADERFMVPDEPPYTFVQTLTPSIPMGRVKIRVIAADGQEITGATWFVADQAPLPVSDSEISLAPGEYTLQVRAPGYAPSTAMTEVTDDALSRIIVMMQPSRVEVTAEHIDLKEKVFFDSGRATIKAVSFQLLDEVGSVLQDHPEITLVRVEGHTDVQGSAAGNLSLSQRRADAVRDYLIGKGVDPGRLEAEGFGETRLLDTGTSAAANERNRRVEISIVARDDG